MSGLSSVKNKPIKIMGKNKIVIGLLKIKQRTPAQYFQHKIFISDVPTKMIDGNIVTVSFKYKRL